MASLGRYERSNNIWPGFVDALATLLMVIIFLLLIFVLAQFFLSQALSGRDSALQRLESQVSELADLLSLEKRANQNLTQNLAQLSEQLQTSVANRDDLMTTITALRTSADENQVKMDQMFSQIVSDKEELRRQSAEIGSLGHEIDALRALRTELETEVSRLAARAAKLNKIINAEKKARSDVENQLIEANEKLRANIKSLEDTKTNLSESRKSLFEERQLSKSARAQLALLNQQMSTLRRQLANLERALAASEKHNEAQKTQIYNLGKRLNAALASKVQELSRYRSEFFGRLRDILGRQRDVRIVGDRFVFQSEVLFDKGSAAIGKAGQMQLITLAKTLKKIAVKIPNGIDWVLRVDGHTDSDPIKTMRFPSNWELSAARAIAVVETLIANGLPPNRLVAAGFGEFQPIDVRSDEIAKRRNRRIELKLTQR